MLINDFYTCRNIQPTEGELKCEVIFNSGHSIFEGHFPGQPVVPGVCMMEMVKELLQQQVSQQLTLRNSKNVKFLGFITPEVQPAIKITWKQADNGYSVNAAFTNGDSTLFKMDGLYSVGDR